MPVGYEVTPELRVKFKEPFGKLIRGSFAETMVKMQKLIKEEKPPMVISVGDIVSQNLHKNRINPKLSIIDNKRMRKRIRPRVLTSKHIVHIKNPPGKITREAVTAIGEALEKDERVQIIVDGEEDLLTIIAVLLAPENSLVVYGQPYAGMVVVKATSEKKSEAKKMLNAMKTVRKAK